MVEFLNADRAQVERVKDAIVSHSSLRFCLAVHDHAGMRALCRIAERSGGDAGPTVEPVLDSWHAGSSGDVYDSDCHLEAAQRPDLEAFLETHAAELALGDDQEIVYEELASRGDVQTMSWRPYVINRTAVLTGAHVENAFVQTRPETNAPEVRLELDDDGSRLFALITRSNVGAKLVITLDDRVLSAPVIQSEVTGGVSTINLGAIDPARAQREAQDLVAEIRAGSLRTPLRLESAIGL